MSSLLPMLATTRDLLMVVLGFSLIIVVHELGHFLAARWAGVRVLAFAVGFGAPLLSYRKGFGLRRGSTETEYNRRLRIDPTLAHSADISPTEYRINALPFGGYVKMLGQDDADPGATSDAPDSFQTCPVWKRMIIISAGVVMNIILAAILFIVVFTVGLRTEPARIGSVAEGKPAATAVPINGPDAGVTEVGLKPGDKVLSIDGEVPVKFQDLILASAMAGPAHPLSIIVSREGVSVPLHFSIAPQVDPETKLQMLGVGPLMSTQLLDAKSQAQRDSFDAAMKSLQIRGLEPGMILTRVDGLPAKSAHDLTRAAAQSGGRPLTATFKHSTGGEVDVAIQPRPEYMATRLRLTDASTNELVRDEVDHLLGLVPVLTVGSASENASLAGLQSGDIFSLLGTSEWPSSTEGILQIRANKGKSIRVAVMRAQPDSSWKEVDLGEVPVDREGRIGFTAANSADSAPFVAAWPKLPLTDAGDALPSGTQLRLLPGSVIQSVAGVPVKSLADARAALLSATSNAPKSEASIALVVAQPARQASGPATSETLEWELPPNEVAALHALSWYSPLSESVFIPEMTLLKATSPVDAIGMGLRETHSVMLTTYLTFARLFQGTVKVTHLKGPVGIAHVGTLLAGRGFVWLLFFMALISVNLAVINFLPIPIADGGHMVFLIYEQATGRPVSPMVQNVSALVGLFLLASIFLIVTFNDLRALFTS